jgi:hypothetical protein
MRDKQGSLYETSNFQAAEAGSGLPKVAPVRLSFISKLKNAGWLIGGLLFVWMVLGEIVIPDGSFLEKYRYSYIMGRRTGRIESAQIEASIKQKIDAKNEELIKTAKSEALKAVEQLKQTMDLEIEKQRRLIKETIALEVKKASEIAAASEFAKIAPEIQKQKTVGCRAMVMASAQQAFN